MRRARETRAVGKKSEKEMTGNTHGAEVAIQLGSNVAPANSRVSGSLQAKLTAAPR